MGRLFSGGGGALFWKWTAEFENLGILDAREGGKEGGVWCMGYAFEGGLDEGCERSEWGRVAGGIECGM